MRTSVAILMFAPAGCAHPPPAPPPPPAAMQATPAAPAPPPPPGRPCLQPPLRALAASIPACAVVPAGVLDATRIKEVALGSLVSVRGFLVLRQSDCTLIACSTRDPATGEQRREACCNGCTGFWRLVGLDEARTTSAPGATPIFLRPAGTVGPLETNALDCVMDALAAGPREEIIASGRLGPARMGSYLDPNAPAARSIADATLCATGRWIPPLATADGGLPACN